MTTKGMWNTLVVAARKNSVSCPPGPKDARRALLESAARESDGRRPSAHMTTPSSTSQGGEDGEPSARGRSDGAGRIHRDACDAQAGARTNPRRQGLRRPREAGHANERTAP